jgi:hypothetical protein
MRTNLKNAEKVGQSPNVGEFHLEYCLARHKRGRNQAQIGCPRYSLRSEYKRISKRIFIRFEANKRVRFALIRFEANISKRI